jgi:AAA-like domain
MRRFSSYGPVDPAENFYVERRDLVERCVAELIDDPDKGGHYFTIWAPRQTGKTWIMRRAIEEIRARYGDRFTVGALSMQGVVLDDDQPDEAFFEFVPDRFELGFGIQAPKPEGWAAWTRLFARKGGYFDRPVILCIDEFDSLPRKLIDRLVTLFRDIYLNREGYLLHGLALVGVRSVLGVDSDRGSPFNVQRSLPIPNLIQGEVTELFAQYQAESGQVVEPAVVDAIFEVTRGQPGLVSWFGELCAEKYNPGPEQPITPALFQEVLGAALETEWNNTVLNLVKKARGPYQPQVVSLFTDPNVPFSLDQDWCGYLYMNGIIDTAPSPDRAGGPRAVCRFSSPFVQRRLYAALTNDMFGPRGPILAIEPIDTLSDVFTPGGLCLPPLLERYRAYLKRLKARGIDPWKGQPRRADLHLTEAVGHFHLYAWLRDAVGRRCTLTPEFPTGNGKVDLVLRTEHHTGVIEVKSFVDRYELGQGHAQAAGYAKKLGLTEATLAVFVPVEEAAVPKELSGDVMVDGVKVTVVALGWV